MGVKRRNLQAQTKILKRLTEHQIQKSMFSSLKVKRSQKFVYGATRRNSPREPEKQ
jgi:hypothetical protein